MMQRRNFLQLSGWGALSFASVNGLTMSVTGSHAFKSAPRGSARNLVLVFLSGGPSHVDTFDLKLGSWTPSDFEAGTFGNLFLPAGLFPNLTQHTDKFSLLRAIEGDEAVHQRAQYKAQTCHTFNPVFSQEQPHLGSLIAYELQSQRVDSDILPAFVAINNASQIQGPGMLPSTYAALRFNGSEGLPGLEHPEGQAVFEQRMRALLDTDAAARSGTAARGSRIGDFHNFYVLGEQMMYEPDVEDAFTVSEDQIARYGDSELGRGCAIAAKVLAKNRGTRVVQVTDGGWDHHYDIYDRAVNNNLYDQCGRLDAAIASMLADLADTPGIGGGSLLDETLVVVTGEFGRTPGALTGNLGRDHYQYAWSSLVAGGGIHANQAFGATDPEGWAIVDRFWNQDRNITIYDLIATMYSSLGIDWTKEIEQTPSGRVYEYTPKVDGQPGYYTDIVEMFA